MKSFKEIAKNMQRGPQDAAGLDIGSSDIKVVRMQKREGVITVSAADILPALDLVGVMAETTEAVPAIDLPPRLRARYGCLALTGESAVVKLLTFPGAFDAKAEEKVVDNMGLEDASKCRISYKLLTEGHGRAESRVLCVALPEAHVRFAPLLLPSGNPVPFSIEVSGIAAMASFLSSTAAQHKDGSLAAIEFGTHTSTFAIFNRGILALVRRFAFGAQAVLDKVREKLGVDAETAQGIVADGSFDISQPLNEVMDAFVKQLLVSRDFVERRENCHVGKLYVSGGLAGSAGTIEEMRSSLEVEVERWDPFEGLQVAKDAIPERLSAQRWRFAAAVGACLGTFEET